jgi:hypothetical protein
MKIGRSNLFSLHHSSLQLCPERHSPPKVGIISAYTAVDCVAEDRFVYTGSVGLFVSALVPGRCPQRQLESLEQG